MLDDGSGGGGATAAAALVRMALLLLVLLGCIRAGRCLVDYYYCTGESRIPSEFGLTMPGGMGWPPYRASVSRKLYSLSILRICVHFITRTSIVLIMYMNEIGNGFIIHFR